jgi:hypothetical protein
VKIINEKTELVSIDKLKPHPKNPRQGDVGAIHVSIEANGFYGSVIAQKSTGHILAGNHRFLAAKHANAEQVPVTWVDVSDEEAVRILLADNRTNDLATYNDDALAELLQDLLRDTGSIEGTGYDLESLDELLKDLSGPVEIHEDDVPEPPVEPITKPGDLWILGEHRLLCGDSTNPEDVERLMAGHKALLCLTDPPYGLGEKKDSGKNDYDQYTDSRSNLETLARGWLPIARSMCRTVVFSPGVTNAWIYPEADWIMCWFYGGGQLRSSWGYNCWQPFLCYGKDPSLATGNGGRPDAVNMNTAANAGDINHPCPKPVALWVWFMERMSFDKNDLFYDPFAGSGTTFVAAEQLNRRCYGMEISPAYCDVTVARWEAVTGQKATLEERNGTPA